MRFTFVPVALVLLAAQLTATRACTTEADCAEGEFCRVLPSPSLSNPGCSEQRECTAYQPQCHPCGGVSTSCPSSAVGCNPDTHFCSSALAAPNAADEGACAPLRCDTACTEDYRPVCGSDGITRSNTCALDQVNCVRRHCSFDALTVACEGECPCEPPTTAAPCANRECPADGDDVACDASFQPVCGSDGKTYSNACVLDMETCAKNECVVASCEGECPCAQSETPRSACDGRECVSGACPMHYSPVCGTDGNTYGNSCVFEATTCDSKTCISVACDGECPCPNSCEARTDFAQCPLGFGCPKDSSCVDDPRDDCALATPTKECPHICVPDAKPMCGGFAGLSCTGADTVCLDNPFDDCDALHGGADCAGLCVSCRAAEKLASATLILTTRPADSAESSEDDDMTTVEAVSIAGGGFVALGLAVVGLRMLRLRSRGRGASGSSGDEHLTLPSHTRLSNSA